MLFDNLICNTPKIITRIQLKSISNKIRYLQTRVWMVPGRIQAGRQTSKKYIWIPFSFLGSMPNRGVQVLIIYQNEFCFWINQVNCHLQTR